MFGSRFLYVLCIFLALPGVALVLTPGLQSAVAQVPRLLHYQATLTDGAFPADGPVDIDVAFFAVEEGGEPVAGWTERYVDVPLTDGRFSLLLGSQTDLPDALVSTPSLYLQLTANGTALPRLRVASTAFALRAESAETAEAAATVRSGGVDAAALADGAVQSDALGDAAVTTRALAPEAVTTAQLAPAAVTTRTLAADAVTTNTVAPGAISTAQLADDAVTSAKIGAKAVVEETLADGIVGTDKLANGAVTAPKVATGTLVTSVNGLTDAVRLVGGTNVTVTPSVEDGTITIDAGSTLSTGSDQPSSRRWKTDVAPISDALALVHQLRGVRYRWTESGSPDLGMIAEEVGGVVPEVVTYAPNGVDAETVNYARLVALLVEAVKEQQAQLDADRALLHELRERLQALETRTPPTP